MIRFGFIPNGGRVYYLARSQPPVFALMVAEYVASTGDDQLLISFLPQLEAEVKFWLENRMVSAEIGSRQVRLFRYRADSNVPRSESYAEDLRAASGLSKGIVEK